MKLYAFTVRFFTSLDWRWIERDYIAENEGQIKKLIDSECLPEYRTKPYRGLLKQGEPVDSLEIIKHNEITLPYLHKEHYET